MRELMEIIEELIEALPDWARKKRQLRLTADQELIFKWNDREGVRLKVVRCNQCAACCLEIPDDYLSFGTNGEGRCNKLTEDGLCSAGHQRPSCCIDDPPENDFKDLGCCIRYF
jgi:hypothetical protein